jgi:hypothetical protein
MRGHRSVIARLTLLLAFLFVLPAAAEPIRMSASGVQLDARRPDATRTGQLDFVAGFDLTSRHARFGGYSGMIIDEGGLRLVAVSDLGHWLVARLRRDETGRLRGVGEAEIHPMLDRRGKSFTIKRAGDAEALERLPDGSLLVAFEQVHRVLRYAGPEPWRSAAEVQAVPAAISRQSSNGGIETMALFPDGRLLLVSETEERADGTLIAWLRTGTDWAELGYAQRDSYRPVDAKVLPDGDLLVLERYFSLLGGFSTRLMRVAAGDVRPGATMRGRLVAEISSPMVTDNFEALAVEPAPDGGTFVFILSDDNRVAIERTLLLQFRLLPSG